MAAQAMLKTHPSPLAFDDELAACIAACFDCAQHCSTCADACLSEEAVAELRGCIRTDLDCADICTATARVLSRQTAFNDSPAATQVKACRDACQKCAQHCEQHGSQHAHCAQCAKACNECAAACDRLLGLID
ncbi:four-helix bundle copper-binding protein [Salinisphaera sp. T31B1]|uniref:four-helix bundle copper-binding protein n=1 Tax=Salinisphaera sp. T31B1 TaxID=727963 RepID=UPI003341BECB